MKNEWNYRDLSQTLSLFSHPYKLSVHYTGRLGRVWEVVSTYVMTLMATDETRSLSPKCECEYWGMLVDHWVRPGKCQHPMARRTYYPVATLYMQCPALVTQGWKTCWNAMTVQWNVCCLLPSGMCHTISCVVHNCLMACLITQPFKAMHLGRKQLSKTCRSLCKTCH